MGVDSNNLKSPSPTKMDSLGMYAIEYAIEEVQRVQHLVNTDTCLYHLQMALKCYKEAPRYPWDIYIIAVMTRLTELKKITHEHRNHAQLEEIQSRDSES
jgi:hypothetical protein